jgi:hypothetical protein
MVHALREAWRVLRADSLLIDLRPLTEHGRVGLLRDGRFTIQWVMRESLNPYRAASRSVAIAEGLKLYDRRASSRFHCVLLFPAAEDLKDWLHHWYETESAAEADRLARRVEEAAGQPEFAGKIAARIPFVLRALAKRNASPR